MSEQNENDTMPDSVSLQQIEEQHKLGWPDIHPEDYCNECGHRNIVWEAEHDLWNMATDPDRHIIICPPCFVRRLELRGVVPKGRTCWKLVLI